MAKKCTKCQGWALQPDGEGFQAYGGICTRCGGSGKEKDARPEPAPPGMPELRG